MENLPEVLQYGFMQRALLSGVVISLICPLVGMFLILRRYALIPDTISHISFAGIALGLFLGINPIISAIVVASLSSFGIEKLRREKGIFGDAALALFLSGSLAVAILIISFGHVNINIGSLLFGSISTVSPFDLATIILLGALVSLSVVFLYRELFLVSFNEDLALSGGINVKKINYLLLFITAFTIAAAIKIVGVLLLGALVVIPSVTAMLFKKSFKATLGFSIIISVIATFGGIISSFYLNAPSGATIVLWLIAFFVLAILATSKSGKKLLN